MCNVMLEQNEHYQSIVDELLNTTEFERVSTAKIVVLTSDQEKKKQGKIVFGECVLVNDKYKWCCDYDFMIIVYEYNTQVYDFTEEQIRILLEHELMHVGYKQDSNEDNAWYIVPHDIEEFAKIIDKYGIEWQGGDYNA